jgi:hypothetical protein
LKINHFICKSLVNAFIYFKFEYFNLIKYPNELTKENFKLLYKLVILKFSLYFITLLKKLFPNEGIILFNKLLKLDYIISFTIVLKLFYSFFLIGKKLF